MLFTNSDVVLCPSCNGDGVNDRKPCWRCGGFGVVKKPRPQGTRE